MNLLLVGLNHRTAPVSVRERHAVSAAEARAVNEKLLAAPSVREGAVLSTCNRTELLAVVDGVDKGTEEVLDLLVNGIGGGSAGSEHVYVHQNRDAVAHVFRVASSLDSMVLGEVQILGQIKDAYGIAAAVGSCGPVLNRLFHRAFRTAKRVRSETGLGGSSISVARVGVQLAREIFESFESKRALLVGAGEMAESGLRGFRDAGLRDVVIANRTLETATRLASVLGGRAVALDGLEEHVVAADIVLTSVAARTPLLTRALIEGCRQRRQRRPLLLVDLGLPRNVEPEVRNLDDVYLYDVDDLEEVADLGRSQRRAAVVPAEAIISLEIEYFERWQAGLRAVPTIVELVERTRRIAHDEVERTVFRLPNVDAATRAMLERMAESFVSKVLHRPLDCLRNEASEGEPAYYAAAIREIFGLEEEE